MSNFTRSKWSLQLLVFLWSFSYPNLLVAWPGKGRSLPKDQMDPNVRDWGDYSDLLPLGPGLELDQNRGQAGNEGEEEPSSSLSPELDFLADFAGRINLLVCLSIYFLHTFRDQIYIPLYSNLYR